MSALPGMSVGGPLLAVGFALFFAGFYLIVIEPRRSEGATLAALGVAAAAAAFELLSHGV